jgi:hypothetical protein
MLLVRLPALRHRYFAPHCAQARCANFCAPQFLQTNRRSFFIAKCERRLPTFPFE